jgi:hypothetical protein
MQEQWVYVRDGRQPVPPDACGYRAQADRIADYRAQHISESVLPYVSDREHPDGHPDGCSVCGRATWWESRELPNGRRQMRCSECRCTLLWPK